MFSPLLICESRTNDSENIEDVFKMYEYAISSMVWDTF